MSMKYLDAHVTIQTGLVSLVNFGHPPPAQLGYDTIFAYGFANEIRHGFPCVLKSD
jgi:hypothetical protein